MSDNKIPAEGGAMFHPDRHKKNQSHTPTKEGAEIPIPEEIMQWLHSKSMEFLDANYTEAEETREVERILEVGAIIMYRFLQPDIDLMECAIETLRKGAAALQSALSSMTAERDRAMKVIEGRIKIHNQVVARLDAAIAERDVFQRERNEVREEANEYKKVLESARIDLRYFRYALAQGNVETVLNKYENPQP